jgi:hypothetical protein
LWRECTSLDGKTFYVNKFTGKLSLEKYFAAEEPRGGILGNNSP